MSSRVRNWVLALSAAIGVGAVATLSDQLVRPGPFYEPVLALSLASNAVCVWGGIGILAGWLVRRTVPAALAGALTLVVAVLVYYGLGVTVGDRKVSLGSAQLLATVEHWLLVAVVGGPLLGILGASLRRRDWLGDLGAVIVVLGTVIDMVHFHHLDRESFTILPWSAAAQVLLIAGSIVLAVASRVAARSQRGRPKEQVSPPGGFAPTGSSAL